MYELKRKEIFGSLYGTDI